MHTRLGRIALFLTTILPLIGTSAACASKKKTATADDVGRSTGAESTGRVVVRSDAPREGTSDALMNPPDPAEEPVLGVPAPIYFEFDSTFLAEESRERLSRLAEMLAARPTARVRVVGHTDERGTDEYNLSLGAGRAGAARDYLVRLGIAPERIDVVSNGEEFPADPGSGEDAWSKNRRDEFELVVADDGPTASR